MSTVASGELVNGEEAGAILGITRARVHQLLGEGRTPEPAVRRARVVLWDRADVERWARERANESEEA